MVEEFLTLGNGKPLVLSSIGKEILNFDQLLFIGY
jgi:hypothetical protein